ncbi:glyoxalase family protein [[Clostridium] leptum DSM 753]|uniref:Glyoxalase family protein n=2 Tax=[Clostridium] leptum DSM 753 TaxID=428125 RepID=A7VYD8_9FIRM|nr:glyoxalase family protein [[Clostridium] leptum DSM 753]
MLADCLFRKRAKGTALRQPSNFNSGGILMKLNTIHHVAIIVSDYERAKEFYVGKLGFQVLRENYQARRGSYKLDLKAGDQELEVFYMPGAPKRVTNPEACGLRHLCFRVESVEEAVRELAALGIEATPIRLDDYTGEKLCFFFDPDGLPLELHE